MTNQRIKYVDFFRGIGILLMIMAHIGFGKTFDHLIHAFHMPMFFFVSGFFFKASNAKQFFSSKARTLLAPYFAYTCLIYGIWRVLFHEPTDNLPRLLLHMNDAGFIAAAMWFLPALFFANACYWCIRRFLHRKCMIHAAVVIVALSGNVYHLVCSSQCPLALDAACVGVGMMHIGFMFRHSDNRITRKLLSLSTMEILAGSAIMLLLIILNKPVNMRTGQYGLFPLFWINSVGSTCILWSLSKKMNACKLRWGGEIWERSYAFMMSMGEHSLVFLCFNQVVIFAAFQLLPVNTEKFGVLFHNLIVLLAVLIFLNMLAYLRRITKRFIHA